MKFYFYLRNLLTKKNKKKTQTDKSEPKSTERTKSNN